MKKLLAMLLCIALLLSMASCKHNKDSEPTDDQSAVAKELYTQAIAPLSSASHITLEQRVTTVTTVDGDDFSEQSTRRLTYQGTGTEDAIIALEESLLFSVHDTEDTDDENQADPISYKEIWCKDTVYASLKDMHRYQSAVSKEEAAKRYTPVILLDAALYGNAAQEATDTGTVIHFTQPTASESWALPQEATLVEASGSAKISAEGKLTKMAYTVTYQYGPAQVKLTVESKPLDTPQTVSVPANKDSYTSIAYADALRTSIATVAKLKQAESLTFSGEDSITSEAAGYVQKMSIQADIHGRKEKTVAKTDSTVSFVNYGTEQSGSVSQEEVYKDGKLTTTSGENGLPTTDSSITWKEVREKVGELITLDVVNPDYWKEVSMTDTGFAYLIEFKFNQNFGNTLQNRISVSLWNDPSFLLNLADSYSTKSATGYLSIDKYTGLPIAISYSYTGLHYIQNKNYALTEDFTQTITAPSKGAYHEITGEYLPEEEPETKATPLFYKVTGKDGQQMYLFGTIHIGDERTAYLPEAIRNAFSESDALALECNTELFEKQLEEDDALAEKLSNLFFYTEGYTRVEWGLQDDYEKACQYLKAVGGYDEMMPYALPFVWTDFIEGFYLQQGYQLHGDRGVEERLMAWAKEQNKEILEIESTMGHYEMLAGFSVGLQIELLKSVLETSSREYWEESMDLYEKWCAGDEAVLREAVALEWDETDLTQEEINKQKPLFEEYYKKMSTDRNKEMLKTAIEYLESDQVIFYAVGLAHLLDGETGLVDALQQAGYTVERLSY